jgi:hypothetical protein
MGRSGYSDCLDSRELNLWRGAVDSAIRGARGQALLRSMLDALDGMPNKRLIASALVRADGECCALGAVAIARGIDVSDVEPTDRVDVADAFDIAPALAAEIAFENDQDFTYWRVEETPERRWARMRSWVAKQIKDPKP